jgi:polyisoprenoid-binding protein YceI
MTTTQIKTATRLPTAGAWEIDASHSNVEFVVRHLLTKMRGRFTEFSGDITIGDEPTLSAVHAEIRAASIDTHNADRDAHLRSPDFLDVESHPVLAFHSTGVEQVSDDRWLVHGDLTLRDVSRPVTLDVTYLGWITDPWGNDKAGFSAHTEIDRDDFGAGWNVVLEAGGLLVGKTVKIELEIEAGRKNP